MPTQQIKFTDFPAAASVTDSTVIPVVQTGNKKITAAQLKTYVANTGYTGSQGSIGYTGSRGVTGYTGSAGTNGSAGATGATGYTGSQGSIGYTGSIGPIGLTGSQGEPGLTGSTGAPGADGSANLPTDATGYLYNDGAGVLSWSAGAGGSYDQSLNTTNTVSFYTLTTNDLRQGPAGSVRLSGTDNVDVLGLASTVVFAAPMRMTSLKLVFTVEGRLDGDGNGTDHTQTCEATVASIYNSSVEPVMSVYGTVYTSPTALATFSVRRGTGNNIEIVATNTQAMNNLHVRVHATQFVSYYD